MLRLLLVLPLLGLGGRLPLAPRSGAYRGSMLGVRATVVLGERVADVELVGVPLGGTLRGVAFFGAQGNVVLDPAFDRALARRGCAIEAVRLAPEGDGVKVWVRLPLLGQRALTLARAP